MFILKNRNIYYIFYLFAGFTGELLSPIPTKQRNASMLSVLTLFYYSWQPIRPGETLQAHCCLASSFSAEGPEISDQCESGTSAEGTQKDVAKRGKS